MSVSPGPWRHRFMRVAATLLPAAIALPVLAGCATMTGMAGGSYSLLSAENERMRGSLAVAATPLARRPDYAPVERCAYSQRLTPYKQASSQHRFDLTVRAVRADRLLVTMTEAGRPSTALIAPDGALHDFNLVQADGSRWTTQNFASEAQRRITDAGGGDIGVINHFSAAFPHYGIDSWQPGDAVATVLSHDGKPWGQYIYRGLANANGVEGAVLDLMAWSGGRQVLVAFNIVDLRNMTPIVYVFDGGTQVRLERTGCS